MVKDSKWREGAREPDLLGRHASRGSRLSFQNTEEYMTDPEGDEPLTVGARLRLAREEMGLSLHQVARSEEHTSELQSRENLVCRLLLEKKKRKPRWITVTCCIRCYMQCAY